MGETAAGRYAALDDLKGLLTVQMILAHCIQFFGDEGQPVQGMLVRYINLTTFSGFLFAFGFVNYLAYYRKELPAVWRRMAGNAGKLLLAFYLSSVGFFALAERAAYAPGLLWRILTLQVFAGWSEFLVAFTAVSLTGMLLFRWMKRLNWMGFGVIGLVASAACFLPYDRIGSAHLALFVGSAHYITFPVVQFLPYFAFGVLAAKRELGFGWRLLAGTALASVPGVAWTLFKGDLPGRFPPTVFFVAGAFFFVYLYYLFCRALEARGPGLSVLRRWLGGVGRNSLFYLLVSNLLIFGFKGSPFHLRGAGFAAIFWVLTLLVCGYLISMVRKPVEHGKQKPEN